MRVNDRRNINPLGLGSAKSNPINSKEELEKTSSSKRNSSSGQQTVNVQDYLKRLKEKSPQIIALAGTLIINNAFPNDVVGSGIRTRNSGDGGPAKIIKATQKTEEDSLCLVMEKKKPNV